MAKKIYLSQVCLYFCSALLFITVYFVLFSYVVGGNAHEFTNRGDVVNILSFAFVSSSLIILFLYIKKSASQKLLGLGLGILSLIMLLVISINRYLAIYPASGAEQWFFYIGILDFAVAMILPIALKRMFAERLSRNQGIIR